MNLLHGECLEVMKTIPDQSIDFILTDPPYGTTACKWDSVIPFEPMWKELKRIRKSNTAIALFGSEPFSSALRMSNIKEFKYDWVWKKNRSSGFLLAKKRPLNQTELISIFYKHQPRYYPIFEEYSESTKKRFSKNNKLNNFKRMQRKDRTNVHNVEHIDTFYNLERGRYPSNVRDFSVPNPQNCARFHPTQKPVALLEYLIKTYTLEGETVLDFTMGSGSTGVACKNLNRKFIGIEQDEKYFEIAKERCLK